MLFLVMTTKTCSPRFAHLETAAAEVAPSPADLKAALAILRKLEKLHPVTVRRTLSSRLKMAKEDHAVMVDRCTHGILKGAPKTQTEPLLAETWGEVTAISTAIRLFFACGRIEKKAA